MSPQAVVSKVFLGLGVALVSLSGVADTSWVGPGAGVLDGDWAVETNWDNGLPSSAGCAFLDDLGSLYTVTMSDAVRQVVKGLTLAGSDAAKRPVLEVNGALVVDGEKMTINQAQMKVNEGGSLELRNTDASLGANADSTGSLWINGGALYATNGFSGLAMGAGTAWSDRFAKFKMTGGTADIVIADGKSAFGMKADRSYKYFEMSGGKITVTGNKGKSSYAISSMGYGSTDAHFTMSGGEIAVKNVGLGFGWGVATIGGDAKISVDCGDSDTLQFGPLYTDAGKTAVINLKDNSQFTASGVRTLMFGISTTKSVNTVGELNISGGTHSFGRYSEMGAGTGTYTMNITGGHTTFDQYGVHFGTYPANANRTTGVPPAPNYFCNTTIVNVTSGVLYARCSECRNNSARNQMWGCVIGNGSGSGVIAADVYDARLNLSGTGIVTNGVAPLLVGVAHACGAITQTGGTLYHDGIAYNENTCAMAIGVGGGTGVYDLSGGTCTGVNNVYVGGCRLSTLDRTGAAAHVPRDGMGESTGRLSVSGTGAFTTTKSLYVGVDGAGEIALADSGSIAVGGTLVLSNAVSSAVNVTLTGTAAPTLTAKKLVIAEGAELTVDVSAFEGEPGYYKILGCTTREGEFEDVELVGDTKGGKIVQGHGSDPSVYYCIPKGLMLILR